MDNDTLQGGAGLTDTFAFAPCGGNDFASNLREGADFVDFSAFGFANFNDVLTIARANDPKGVYLVFTGGEHLAISGVSLTNFGTRDVTLVKKVDIARLMSGTYLATRLAL